MKHLAQDSYDPCYNLSQQQICLAWECLYNNQREAPPELQHLSPEQWMELALSLSHQFYLKQQSPLQ